MKATHSIFASLALIAGLAFPATIARAQGPLAAPGTPVPTMKTLAQVEPRTPLSAAGTISQSGSYYLTTNITVSSGDVLTITANNVKLDLNGFALTSTDPNGASHAIVLSGSLTNITIANGLIYSGVTNNGSTTYGGPGFSYGIYGTTPLYNVRVKDIQVYGCRISGIMLSMDTPTLVKGCTVNDVGAGGIMADMILDCSVNAGGGLNAAAIQGNTVCNCRGVSISGAGVRAAHNAYNCYGASGSSYGVYATVACNCYATSTNQSGLYSSVVNNSYGSSSTANGINAFLGCNSIGANTAAGSAAFYATYLAVSCAGYGPSGIYSLTSLVGCAGTTTGASYKFGMP